MTRVPPIHEVDIFYLITTSLIFFLKFSLTIDSIRSKI